MRKNKKKQPELRFPEFTDDWEQRKLGELGTVQTCKRIFKEQTSEQGDIPFFKNGTIGLKPDAYISRELYEEFRELYPYPEVGDTLISVVGSIGRTAEYTGKDEYFQDSNVVWLKTDGSINKKFLKISYQVIKWLIEGSTVKHLYNDNILQSKIVMPTSQKEQGKIAEIFEYFDHLITLHQRKLEKLKEMKKGVMQKLFSQEVRFKADDGSEFPDWEEKKLGEVCSYRRGSFPQPYGLDEWYDEINGKPFIQVADVNDDMKVNKTTKRHISKLAEEKSVFVESGTLIITLQGTIGRVAITTYDAYVDRTLLIIQNIDDCLNIEYLKLAMRLLFDIEKRKADGGIIKTITKETLTNFTFSIPCLAEQQKIADCLSSLDDVIEKQKATLAAWEEMKKGLLQQMFV